MSEPLHAPEAEPAGQPIKNRGDNRSQRPRSDSFKRFITSGWGPRVAPDMAPGPAAPFTAVRRARLSALFPGDRLVLPAGSFKVRSNDCDYRFRPHSAFAYLTGLGTEQEPDAVLVLHPVADGAGDNGSGHRAMLYFRPLAGRDTEEFYSDSAHTEKNYWTKYRVCFSADDNFMAFLLDHGLNGDTDYLGIGVVSGCSLNQNFECFADFAWRVNV